MYLNGTKRRNLGQVAELISKMECQSKKTTMTISSCAHQSCRPNTSGSHQNVFLKIAYLPFSSYSRLETHMFLKVPSEAKIEPPTQVDNVR